MEFNGYYINKKSWDSDSLRDGRPGAGVREPVGPRIFTSPSRPSSWMFVSLPPIVRVENSFSWLSGKYTHSFAMAEDHENSCLRKYEWVDALAHFLY
jgi:hypothetical protein